MPAHGGRATVMPETSTARPEVAVAMSSASKRLSAALPLLTGAGDHEQRVVDADGHADQQHDRGRDVRHRQHVARDAGEAEARAARELGLVSRPGRSGLEAEHGLHAAGACARPRDDLQVRRRERAAQPVARPTAGLVGKLVVDGKPVPSMPPDQPSHTFAVPALGILVPVAPVADDAKNPCDYAPCRMSMAHRTITFTFRTGGPDASAGSASSRAPRGSSTASAARCRRSGTWTASSTSSDGGERPWQTVPVARLALSVVAIPLVRSSWATSSRRGTRPRRRPSRRSTTLWLAAIMTPPALFVLVFLVYVLIAFRNQSDALVDGPPIRGDARPRRPG